MRPTPAVLAVLLVACASGTGADGAGASSGGEHTSPTDAQLVCAQDTECVLVPGACSGVVATNLEHALEVREIQHRLATVASCDGSHDETPSYDARCLDGTCTALRMR